MKEIQLKRVNVTLVYDDLTSSFISHDKIKKAYSNAQINDGPENIVIVNFDSQKDGFLYQANYDERRLYMNAHVDKKIEKISDLPINYMAEKIEILHKAIEGKKQLVAYGFNFDGIGDLEEGTSSKKFKDNFMKNVDELENKTGGEVCKVAPKFTLDFGEYIFNISLNPGDETNSTFKVHLNSHFETESLPSKEKLAKKIEKYYNENIKNLNELVN